MSNARTNSNLNRRAGRLALFGALLGGVVLVSGCDDECVFCSDCGSPGAPVNVYSVTGDEEVAVYWTPVDEDEVYEFVVYRSGDAVGPYREIGHTRHDSFVDRGVSNGRTYFYAVTAIDECGYESDLSRELVHDTPRPEGFGERLYDANGEGYARSGWDFDDFRARTWNDDETDIYFVISEGVPYLVAADLATDIQDAGYAGFDDVDWAPEAGWSPTGTVEVIPGHMVIVWTRDDHFAKLRVRSIEAGRLTFDWAYQVDRGNHELAPRPGGDLRIRMTPVRPGAKAL